MDIEHRTTPIEHWIVDGKAYRLATEADIGKDCYFSDAMMSRLKSGIDRCLHGKLTRFNAESTDKYWSGGTCWMFALIQDDSLLAPQQSTETSSTTKPIDWTKPVRTKLTKWPVTLVTVKGRGDYPVVGYVGDNTDLSQWNLQGNKPGRGEDPDGLENVPQRIQREYWVNVYEDSGYDAIHDSSKHAAEFRNTKRKCLACVKITIDCEEGEGL